MAEEYDKERTLEETSTWAVAVVCLVLLVISLSVEHFIHLVGKFLKKRRKVALVESLEKVKSELMLLGFISLLLTVFQTPISNICVSRKIAGSWRPCSSALKSPSGAAEDNPRRKLLEFLDLADIPIRRSLATKGYDKCTGKGKYAFVTAYGIHQLHIFIFVLAIMHVIYCMVTLLLGNIKVRYDMNKMRPPVLIDPVMLTYVTLIADEEMEDLVFADPERFRFARDTSFGRRHLSFWSRSTITLWIVSFFRQFFASVTKVDYMTLRHGFIVAHLSPDNATKFDFQKYIHRSLEEDFKVIVGISPVIWLAAVLFLLTNTHGWYSYFWLPILSLVIVLLIGTKLQVIITKLGLRIQERGQVVKGTPVVQPGDELFWFGRPRLLLFLIHFVLFQNAFQLAFFAWSTYEFGLKNCFHQDLDDIILRVSLGIFIQVLCSYVTLPLYALVTQMGTSMKTTIFDDRVATALKQWHHMAKKHVKASKHHGGSGEGSSTSQFSSRPATPLYGTSPMHLLHAHNRVSHVDDSPRVSPYRGGTDSRGVDRYDDLDSQFRRPNDSGGVEIREHEAGQYPVTRRQDLGRPPVVPPSRDGGGQEETEISFSDFRVRK